MPEDELEPLITECPSCQTRFRVSESQLQRARGRVRCGACLSVFHGIEHLVPESFTGDVDEDQAREALDALLDELAADSGSATPAPEGGSRETPADSERPRASRAPDRGPRKRPAIFAGFEDPVSEGEKSAAASDGLKPEGPDRYGTDTAEVPAPTSDGQAPTRKPAADLPAADISAAVRRAAKPAAASRDVAAFGANPAPETAAAPKPVAPMEVPKRPAPETAAVVAAPADALSDADAITPVKFGEIRPPRPLVWAGIVAGVLLLVAQVLWYQFDDWAKEPAWRSVYASICNVIGCELPVQRDIAQLNTRNLVVRIHPDQSGSLLVNAVIVNHADFAQPFPVLELQFTTVRGNLVAARRFEPGEYLAGDARGMTLIPPRTPVQIELSMADPGPDAVNYRLNLR